MFCVLFLPVDVYGRIVFLWCNAFFDCNVLFRGRGRVGYHCEGSNEEKRGALGKRYTMGGDVRPAQRSRKVMKGRLKGKKAVAKGEKDCECQSIRILIRVRELGAKVERALTVDAGRTYAASSYLGLITSSLFATRPVPAEHMPSPLCLSWCLICCLAHYCHGVRRREGEYHAL